VKAGRSQFIAQECLSSSTRIGAAELCQPSAAAMQQTAPLQFNLTIQLDTVSSGATYNNTNL